MAMFSLSLSASRGADGAGESNRRLPPITASRRVVFSIMGRSSVEEPSHRTAERQVWVP